MKRATLLSPQHSWLQHFPSSLIWPAAAFILLLLMNAVMNPSFFSFTLRNGQLFGSLVDIAFRSSPLILSAFGLTLIIATAGIDLSVGSIAALSAAAATTALASGAGVFGAVAAALAAGAFVGICNAALVTLLGLQPIIATLISMVTARGVAQLLLGGQIVPITNEAFAWIGTGALFGLPFAVWFTMAVTLFLGVGLRRTSAALFIEAVGSNALAARFIGLSTSKIRATVYVLTGVLAAFAGLIMSTNIHAVDGNNLGLYLELDAILAVVIGGTRLTGGRFSILGTVLGALIIQTVTTTINTQGVRVEFMLMVKAAVVITICLAQSDRARLRRKPESSVPALPETRLNGVN